jgi:CTP-dependent riboflavin kinase
VSSGLGEGARFTRLDWVLAEFRAKLGFAPHPGTFNLRLQGIDWERARRALRAAAGIPITPAPGYCGARCFPVVVGGHVPGVAVLPDVAGYPEDKLEILSPVALRAALGVGDGDRVRLRLELESVGQREQEVER